MSNDAKPLTLIEEKEAERRWLEAKPFLGSAPMSRSAADVPRLLATLDAERQAHAKTREELEAQLEHVRLLKNDEAALRARLEEMEREYAALAEDGRNAEAQQALTHAAEKRAERAEAALKEAHDSLIVEKVRAEGFKAVAEKAEAEVERLRARLPREPFDVRCADALADEVAALIRNKVLDPRSPAGDALLDYRNPPSTPRADRLAKAEAEVERLREALLACKTRVAMESSLTARDVGSIARAALSPSPGGSK